MKDQIVFQISGNVKEKSTSDEDVKLIIEQTNVKDEEKIKKLLQENNGDVAKTIMQLKK
jgi:NACalpha-BTF3-like transcription factor